MKKETKTNGKAPERIDSWKEIASFLGRDERTVQRWEKERQLPIHRVPGERGGVFAYRSELSRWFDATASLDRSGGDFAGLLHPPERGREDLERPTHVNRPRAADAPAAPDAAFGPQNEASGPQNTALATRDTASGSLVYAPSRRDTWLWRVSGLTLSVLLVVFGLVYGIPHYRTNSRLRSAAVTSPSHTGAGPASGAQEPDPKAKELYLRGRYYWSQRTGAGLAQALDAFTQAIVQDPNYCEAYTGLAETYELMPQYGSMPPSEAFPRALVAAQRAVALNPQSADAHRVLAFVEFYWEWQEKTAFSEFQRAIALRPDDAEVHHWYANALLLVHRTSEATAEIQRARELDPSSRAIVANQILIQSTAGLDVQECLRRLRELERDEPNFPSPSRYIAVILVTRTNDFGAYVAQLKRIADKSQSPADRKLAQAAESGLKSGGAPGMFRELQRTATGLNAGNQVSSVEVGLICTHSQDFAAAVQYFRKAYEENDFALIAVVTDAQDPMLQQSPEYRQLQTQVQARLDS